MAWRLHWALCACCWAAGNAVAPAAPAFRHQGPIARDVGQLSPGAAEVVEHVFEAVPDAEGLVEHVLEAVPGLKERLLPALDLALGRNDSHRGLFSGNSSSSPFAKNFTSDEDEPFVKVDVFRNASQNSTVFTVEIATPNIIISVYLLMFVPIVMSWVAMHHYGTHDRHYLIILPITLCSMIVGQDLVNQSLSALMESPIAITFIQALACAIMTGAWTITAEVQKPSLSKKSLWPLAKWGLVAVMFAGYQLVNHLVSYTCSLSERTVFLNLSPVASLAFESAIMPKRMQSPQVSFMGKMALAVMVLGAVLFSLQYPFTTTGAASAIGLVAVVIPYRLLQRLLLVDSLHLPVYALAAFDGLFLTVPSGTITAINQTWFWRSWEGWLSTPSIALMLVLSFATFTGNHVSSLLLLRASSATNFLVFSNVANFVVVLEGIIFFGDEVVQNPLVFTGIFICLVSGVWYSIESGRGLEKSMQAAKADNEEGTFSAVVDSRLNGSKEPLEEPAVGQA